MLTQTARNKVEKAARLYALNGKIRLSEVHTIRNQNSTVTFEQVRGVVTDLGIHIVDDRPPPPAPTKPKVDTTIIDDITLNSIINGSIYKIVEDLDMADDPDDVFVVTTYGRWKKERDVLRKLLKK
jgi:hypothetical protein